MDLGALAAADATTSWSDITAGIYMCSAEGTMYAGQTDGATKLSTSNGSNTARYNPRTGIEKPVIVIEYRESSSAAAGEEEAIAVINDIKEARNVRVGAGQVRARMAGGDASTNITKVTVA